jgi:AbrB family looped-hinge helix DNA binding protein
MKSTLSEKGQVTIPKAVRAQLGLQPGTEIEFRAESGQLIGRKVTAEDPFRKWRGRGSLPKGLSVDDYLTMVRGTGANGR